MLGALIAAAQLAIQVGSAIAGHAAQDKQAKATRIAADEAAATQFNALNARSLEERIAAAQAINEGGRQAASAASLARLSAITAGVSGQSADAITQGIEGDLGRFTDSIDQNLEVSQFQLERAGLGIEAQRKGRINGVPPANPFLTGLTIGSDVVDFIGKRIAQQTPKG